MIATLAGTRLPYPVLAGTLVRMTDLTQYWPSAGIVLQTRRLRLTGMRESDFPEAIDAILAGIHDPAAMPFGIPWTDAAPAELVPNALRHW
ncbi:MAG: hypothetical protein M3Y77_21640, partial [Actinomycetota bacterium]|nr:hypothetical protein [Actinomycetota bacterium]